MNRNFLCLGLVLLAVSLRAQFALTPTPWHVPNNFEDAFFSAQPLGFGHIVIDMDGDGRPDLVDGRDDFTSYVFGNGTPQIYWNVYRNMGLHFNLVPAAWQLPYNYDSPFAAAAVHGQDHGTIDLNGDGLPDLIDGIDGVGGNVFGYGTSQCYWKVYFNNANGFNLTPFNWNIPIFEDSVYMGRVSSEKHMVQDIDGDGLPDLIDGIDNTNMQVYGSGTTQRYWKVYRNLGTGFDPQPLIWNIPIDFEDSVVSGAIYSLNHHTMDMTGDGKADLIDGFNNLTGKVFGYGTSQWYWNVYPNTGTGFSAVPLTWNLPFAFDDSVQSGRPSTTNHTTLDLDGDGLWDLVDGIDDLTGVVYGFGSSQQYWHLYLNNGAGFDPVPDIWNIPNNFETPADCGRTTGFAHRTIDMDGDGRRDLIEGKDELTGNVHGDATPQRYWNIFYNRVDATGFAEGTEIESGDIFPNPTTGKVKVQIRNGFKPTKAVVYDALGQIVSQQDIHPSEGIEVTLDGPPGIYFVLLQSATSKQQQNYKVIKQLN